MNGIGGDLLRDRVGREDEEAARARRHAAGRRTPRRPKSSPGAASSRCRAAVPLSVDVPGVVDGWSQLLHALRHHHAGQGAAAGDPLRARGIPGAGNHGRRLERLDASGCRRIRRPRGRFCPTGARRSTARSSPTRGSPRALELIAAGRARRVLQGPDRARDRRRHARARRAARRARLRRRTPPTGSRRSRPTIAATTCTRCRRARRASSRSRC